MISWSVESASFEFLNDLKMLILSLSSLRTIFSGVGFGEPSLLTFPIRITFSICFSSRQALSPLRKIDERLVGPHFLFPWVFASRRRVVENCDVERF